jgi:predicted RNA-binding protein
MKIVLSYSDGLYSYREALADDRVTVEVPESTIEMWDTVLDAIHVMQDQMRELDNASFDDNEPQTQENGDAQDRTGTERETEEG